MRSIRRRLGLTAALLLTVTAGMAAQVVDESVDLDVVQKIRDEGLNRSHIDQLAGYLTDVIGARLTGSPAMRRANDWTAGKLREWGLQNVTVEPWGEFGRGWSNVRYSGRVVEPYVKPLHAYPAAWTGSTKGTATGPVVIVEADSMAGLTRYRGKLKGAFVMMQRPPETEPEFDRRPLRTPLDSLLAPAPERGRDRERYQQRIARYRRLRALQDSMADFLRQEGVAVVLQPSRRAYGILGVSGASSARDPKAPIPPAVLVVGLEQYGRIYRDVGRGLDVKLEVNVENTFYDKDVQAYNTLGDIPGSDRADEYVMLGAHLDSWHSGTGATDNGAGTVVMMEAVRILKALGLQPRRTIRIGLWSGEEQGLLGSRGWVEKHQDLWPKISAYVNVDNGTGRIRGIWDQSNAAAIPIFEETLWPFKDLGVVAVRHGDTGGTDHLSFDRAGIPGFNFIQDPIEYETRTHHTYVDTYERLLIDDLKQAAVVVAYTVYHLAMRDEMMPRKSGEAATGEE